MLKITAVLGMLVCASLTLSAQQKTLFDGESEFGGYGGPIAKVTQINDEWGVMAGGAGAWTIDNTFAIGGAGYGLATEIETGTVDQNGKPLFMDLGYGGMTMHYIYGSDKLVHFTVGGLIGAGGLEYRTGDGAPSKTHDAFYVVEPEATVEMNVANFLRVGAGGSYRFTFDVDASPLENSDLSGPSGFLFFKFGGF